MALYFKVFTKFCCSFLASKATSEVVVMAESLAAALAPALALANCLVLSALGLEAAAFGAIANQKGGLHSQNKSNG